MTGSGAARPFAAGIIAAGDGTRLQGSHPGLVKPLVPVGGRPLCHWVVGGLAAAGARRVTMLLNSKGGAVKQSLRAAFPDLPFTFLTADTASSWESFRLVSRALSADAEDFVISTVDALVPPAEAARFAAAARGRGWDAALALTSFVDDEKPLWARAAADGRLLALGDEARGSGLATAGLYYLTRVLAEAMPKPGAHPNLRGYLRDLVRADVPLGGVALAKTLDVDRPEDLAQAEEFLKAGALEARP